MHRDESVEDERQDARGGNDRNGGYESPTEEQYEEGVLRSVDETILLKRTGRRSTASTNISGVERGYRTIARELRDVPNVSQDDIRRFEKITKKIMLRSYLAQRKPFSAIRTLLTW